MTDDEDLRERVEQLEAEVDELQSQLEEQAYQYAMIATHADIEALPDVDCPECDGGTLEKRSGFSWSKAICQNCSREWILSQ